MSQPLFSPGLTCLPDPLCDKPGHSAKSSDCIRTIPFKNGGLRVRPCDGHKFIVHFLMIIKCSFYA